MKSEGICTFCGNKFISTAMTRHLSSCNHIEKPTLKSTGTEKYYLLKASAGPFFVYFEVNSSATLNTIDTFLRGLWLDCCGHLSAFTINHVRYSSYDEELDEDEKSMNIKLGTILQPNLSFLYEYDFGTTTELELKVLEEIIGKVKKILPIARNIMPDFRCKCKEIPTHVCAECLWDDAGFLCEKCSKKHECGEDMLLPVVNSPRMGMCGYTG